MSKYTEKLPIRTLLREIRAFSQGRSSHAWRCFGAHPARDAWGQEGWLFRVWAPNAPHISLVGDFNRWNLRSTPMTRDDRGIWEVFVPGLARYDSYAYAIHDGRGGVTAKADPFAFHAETRPGTSSKLYDPEGDHPWQDGPWLAARSRQDPLRSPMNVYECHLGSWRRTGEGGLLSYREMADYLVPYLREMGYTHVELLPVTEHPLDASWGYQCTGYFAPTSRFGTPADLKYLIDRLHQGGIGVILDWVPAHFPRDAFGLYRFDGTPTFEYADPQMGEHPTWGTNCFDLGKPEVRSFLLSSATFWLEEYHADGLRVDAVSSMLYLSFGRKEGEWTPNPEGGPENPAAVEFLRLLTSTLKKAFPHALLFAEEATAWPGVTAPVEEGGLGFTFKWNMGWAHDTLHYMETDPLFRRFCHTDLTFPSTYSFGERYILPLSHDEVCPARGSLVGRMPGKDHHLKLAGVRAFYAYMMTHPGKKLSFMGSEFGQGQPWRWEQSLDWHLLEYDLHRQVQAFFRDMNAFYLSHRALWEADTGWEGMEWISPDDRDGNVIAFLRRDRKDTPLLVVCNFAAAPRPGYRIGVPIPGSWKVEFSTDAAPYGGSGAPTPNRRSEPLPCHGREHSVVLDLPSMSCLILRCVRRACSG